jgi:hypothetical protein
MAKHLSIFSAPCVGWASVGLLTVLSACGGGGGGGGGGKKFIVETGGPNDSANQAQKIPLHRDCVGSLSTLGDVDYWSVNLSAGSYVQIELLGTRLGQATWFSGDTVPRVTLVEKDGATPLLRHDFIGNVATAGPWGWGKHDLDLPMWRVPSGGEYFLRFECDDPNVAGGLYAFEVRKVSAPGAQLETEGTGISGLNDTAATAQPINPGMVHGWHVDDENDFYSFTLAAASRLEVEVFCYRNGVHRNDTSYADLQVNLVDSTGTTVLRSMDDAAFSDPLISQLLPAGSYFLDVTDSAADGDAEYLMRVEISGIGSAISESEANDTAATADSLAKDQLLQGALSTPTDEDYFRISGSAGEMVRVRLWDEDNGSLSTMVDDVEVELLAGDGTTVLDTGGDGELEVHTVILQAPGSFYVRLRPDASPATTDYYLRVESVLTSAYESEINNTISTADKLNSQGRAAGVIGTPGDLDVFSFKTKGNRLVTIDVYAGQEGAGSDGFSDFSDFGSDLRPLLRVLDSNGFAVAASAANSLLVGTEGVVTGLPVGTVSFIAFTGGTYYVEVSSAAGESGSDQYYVIDKR